jgi:hypothetical protein
MSVYSAARRPAVLGCTFVQLDMLDVLQLDMLDVLQLDMLDVWLVSWIWTGDHHSFAPEIRVSTAIPNTIFMKTRCEMILGNLRIVVHNRTRTSGQHSRGYFALNLCFFAPKVSLAHPFFTFYVVRSLMLNYYLYRITNSAILK